MFKDLFSHIRMIYSKVKLPESLLNPMATDDNPKVSGYLPPAVYNVPPGVYDQLMAFKAKRGLQSVEMAVIVILSEYFSLFETSVGTGTDTTASRLETLEAKCASLSETVAELRAAIATRQASSSPPLGESEPPAIVPDKVDIESGDKERESALIQPDTPFDPTDTPKRADNLSQALPPLPSGSEDTDELAGLNGTECRGTDQSEPPAATAASASHNGAIDELTETGSLLIRPQSELPLESDSSAAPRTPDRESTSAQGGELAIPESLNQPFSTPMTQAALARRLGVSTSSISRMQSKPNFLEWSQQKDPEGIAWVKSPDTKLFYPQTRK